MQDTSRSGLSHSRGWTWHTCKKAYDYKYIQWLKPIARDIPIEFWEPKIRGIVTHAGIEGGLLGQSVERFTEDSVGGILANDILDDEKKALLEKIQVEAAMVATDFLEWLPASDWEPVVYNGRSMVEAELSMPLPGWKHWNGYVDLLARYKPNSSIWVLDWKTRERFDSVDADRFNSQFALYQRAARVMGIDCVGSLLCEIKPEPPKTKPKKGKKLRVDVGGIDGPRISTDGRFSTTPTFRPNVLLNGVWKDTLMMADDMRAFDPAKHAYRNMNKFACGRCDFQRLCMAELNGEDADDVRATSYTKSTYTPRNAKPASPLIVID